MTRIKICGLTNLEDALLAVELGADALGFIFSESPRKITVEKARFIINHLPPFIIKVGVFVNEAVDSVKKIDSALGLHLLQFHGDESVDYVRSFDGKGIKAFRVAELLDLEIIAHSGFDFFILDSKIKGQPFDLEIALRAKRYGKFLLGGGLNPENVEQVLEKVSPFGIDACSGIEIHPGKKDPEKLREFIWRIKKWDYQLASSADSGVVLSPKP